jgi:hypothetical protein
LTPGGRMLWSKDISGLHQVSGGGRSTADCGFQDLLHPAPRYPAPGVVPRPSKSTASLGRTGAGRQRMIPHNLSHLWNAYCLVANGPAANVPDLSRMRSQTSWIPRISRGYQGSRSPTGDGRPRVSWISSTHAIDPSPSSPSWFGWCSRCERRCMTKLPTSTASSSGRPGRAETDEPLPERGGWRR